MDLALYFLTLPRARPEPEKHPAHAFGEVSEPNAA